MYRHVDRDVLNLDLFLLLLLFGLLHFPSARPAAAPAARAAGRQDDVLNLLLLAGLHDHRVAATPAPAALALAGVHVLNDHCTVVFHFLVEQPGADEHYLIDEQQTEYDRSEACAPHGGWWMSTALRSATVIRLALDER